MLETVTAILQKYKHDAGLRVLPETRLEALGLDSLDMVQIMMDVETVCGVTIALDRPAKTVGEILALVAEAQKRG